MPPARVRPRPKKKGGRKGRAKETTRLEGQIPSVARKHFANINQGLPQNMNLSIYLSSIIYRKWGQMLPGRNRKCRNMRSEFVNFSVKIHPTATKMEARNAPKTILEARRLPERESVPMAVGLLTPLG